ncbi:MAG TPA: hypothetical protein VK644_10675 [Chitinophagaceae bacterium]|nr:hypothetical protein [Chitinophagaceae bacterium]
MKKQVTLAFSFLLLFSAQIVSAQQNENGRKKYEFVKQKDMSNTYPSTNKLTIENSFGNVKYIAWDKNEIKVDVHIEVSATKDEVAKAIFELIMVTNQQKDGGVEYKTSIKNNKEQEKCKDCKSNMSIDYEIHLPVSVTLNTSNSFGNTELPDYKGPVDINSKFGELTTGVLSNIKDISVEFGKASIKSATNLDATFKFSQISIDNLSGKNVIKLEFCDNTRISLAADITSLSLHDSYSTVNLRPGSIGADYSISTSFGDFVDRTGVGIKRTDKPDQYGPDSDRKFSGQSGNGNAKIEIKSSFGKIVLGEPNADDLKAMEKKKKGKTI